MLLVYCEGREGSFPFVAGCVQRDQADWRYRVGIAGERKKKLLFLLLIRFSFGTDAGERKKKLLFLRLIRLSFGTDVKVCFFSNIDQKSLFYLILLGEKRVIENDLLV